MFVPALLYSIFGRSDFSVSPFRMYLICWNVFISFYASHWEKYNTGEFYVEMKPLYVSHAAISVPTSCNSMPHVESVGHGKYALLYTSCELQGHNLVFKTVMNSKQPGILSSLASLEASMSAL